jgi:hypothetical protein
MWGSCFLRLRCELSAELPCKGHCHCSDHTLGREVLGTRVQGKKVDRGSLFGKSGHQLRCGAFVLILGNFPSSILI